jgi:hypothetical protein
MKISGIATILACLAGTVLPAAAAPEQIRGKSVVINWTEQRRERNPATGQEQTKSVPFVFTTYVSTADRIFNRLSVGRGSSDQVKGSRDAAKFAPRAVVFSGNRMTATNTFISGGARQIAATFDASFSSCSATVVIGKGSGGPIKQSLMAGGVVELLSVSPGAANCAVSQGNALGN